MRAGWERGEPWGPLQLFCVTAAPICSKKILCRRSRCGWVSFVLPEWNDNVGEQEENSTPWCGLFTWNIVLFKFVMNELLFVIRTAVTDLSSLLFLHVKWALCTDFPQAVASFILFILLHTYEIFMKEECSTLGIT